MRQRLAGCMEGINGPVTVQAPSLPMWSGDLDQLAGLAQQLPHAAAELDGLVAVSAMLQGIAIAGRGTAALGAPCMRQRCLPVTAGDWQALPDRVRAPHLGLWCMGKCMGSILISCVAPSPLGDGADDRLAAGLHGDVLDPDHLLALAAVPVERVGQRRERAHQPVAVLQPQLAAGEGLLGQGGPAEAFHGSLARRHHLVGPPLLVLPYPLMVASRC